MNGKRRVYLDANGGAKPLPASARAMTDALSGSFGNPSSLHREGQTARAALEAARRDILSSLGGEMPAWQLCFTSGATEANNLVIASCRSLGLPIFTAATEHLSVLAPAAHQAENASQPSPFVIPVDGHGRVEMAWLDRRLAALPPAEAGHASALVCVMGANNETGIIAPLADIVALVARHNALLLCDAAQLVGRTACPLADMAAHFVTMSAHKFGGPPGIGAVLANPAGYAMLTAQMRGGGQEDGMRPGTENLPAILAFAAALREVMAGQADESLRLAGLRDMLETRLAEIAPECRVFGSAAQRLVNTSCFAMPGLSAEAQIVALDLAGIAVATGSACSSGVAEPSHVLRAMGVTEQLAGSAIRVSLGWYNSDQDIEEFVAAWRELVVRHRRLMHQRKQQQAA